MKVISGFVIFATMAILLYAGCESDSAEDPAVTVAQLVETFADAELETERDVREVVDNAANSPLSVSYIHLRWSATSEWFKFRYAEFVLEYERCHPEQGVQFHFIDCTAISSDYSALFDLPGWDKETHRIGGNGEIVWMRNGSVIHVDGCGGYASAEELVAKSESLFDESARSDGA